MRIGNLVEGHQLVGSEVWLDLVAAYLVGNSDHDGGLVGVEVLELWMETLVVLEIASILDVFDAFLVEIDVFVDSFLWSLRSAQHLFT